MTRPIRGSVFRADQPHRGSFFHADSQMTKLLHIPFPPRGLRREWAAEYVGVSPSKFDEWVKGGVMPDPVRRGRCVIWDRKALDRAFDRLYPDATGGGWEDSSAAPGGSRVQHARDHGHRRLEDLEDGGLVHRGRRPGAPCNVRDETYLGDER